MLDSRSSVRAPSIAEVGASLHATEPLDPFSLVADELSILANRLRSMVVAKVPVLASAAENFLNIEVKGKRFRPTVLLLMATAIDTPISRPPPDTTVDTLYTQLRTRQQSIAEIAEMIHLIYSSNSAFSSIVLVLPSGVLSRQFKECIELNRYMDV